MKNLTKIAAFVFISAFLFSACEKEGQYLPKKKITRIEYSTTTSSKDGKDISTLSEVQDWVWNGKLLQTITYKDGSGNQTGKLGIVYDSKKRISQLQYSTSSYTEIYNFFYDGKELKKIVVGDDEYTFTRTDGNIVEINVGTALSSEKNDAGTSFNPLQFVLPAEVANVIKASAAKGASVYKLTWDGKNISHCQAVSNGVVAAKYSWKYDEYINPFRGLFGYSSLTDMSELYSANNVVESVTEIPTLSYQSSQQYSYEYDGKFPVKQVWVTSSTFGLLETTHTNTFFYN